MESRPRQVVSSDRKSPEIKELLPGRRIASKGVLKEDGRMMIDPNGMVAALALALATLSTLTARIWTQEQRAAPVVPQRGSLRS